MTTRDWDGQAAEWVVSEDGTPKSAILEMVNAEQRGLLSQAAIVIFPTTARGGRGLTRDAAVFAKIHRAEEQLAVAWPEERLTLHFHANEVWLWGIWVAQNVGIPIFVALLSNYIYEQFGRRPSNEIVHLDLSVENEEGKVRRIKYDGPAADLMVDLENGKFAMRAMGEDDRRSK